MKPVNTESDNTGPVLKWKIFDFYKKYHHLDIIIPGDSQVTIQYMLQFLFNRTCSKYIV